MSGITKCIGNAFIKAEVTETKIIIGKKQRMCLLVAMQSFMFS